MSTGVRTAIMQAIAKKFSTPNQAIYVRHFVLRPTLLLKTKQGDEVKEVGLTFVDVLKRFGKDLKQYDLE